MFVCNPTYPRWILLVSTVISFRLFGNRQNGIAGILIEHFVTDASNLQNANGRMQLCWVLTYTYTFRLSVCHLSYYHGNLCTERTRCNNCAMTS